MKESKFWIWFIPLLLIASIGIYVMLSRNANNNENNNTSDAIKIKEEYSKNNNNYYEVNLNDNNVYKYIGTSDLKELLNKNDGLVFVGDTTNNITRKNIYVLNDVVLSTSVPEVNYIDIKDVSDEIINVLKDKKEINNIKAGTLIAVQGGNILNIYYPDYVENNKELSTEENDKLNKTYREIVKKFIEECDENC